ncbi:hypothetical protein [Bradyrhizobium sp. CCGUVB1N3]|nr:hypothetical protein [Bradyrhizobium sp. CCGUVB1N3]
MFQILSCFSRAQAIALKNGKLRPDFPASDMRAVFEGLGDARRA